MTHAKFYRGRNRHFLSDRQSFHSRLDFDRQIVLQSTGNMDRERSFPAFIPASPTAESSQAGKSPPGAAPAPTGAAIPIIPSLSSFPQFKSTTPLLPLIGDERAIQRLLGILLKRADLTAAEAARRLGMTPQTIGQYLRGERKRCSLYMFLKLVEICGGKVQLEFPASKGARL